MNKIEKNKNILRAFLPNVYVHDYVRQPLCRYYKHKYAVLIWNSIAVSVNINLRDNIMVSVENKMRKIK